MDISYSMHDKTILYSEDIRAAISSLREAFEFTQKRAAEAQYTESYKENLNFLSEQIKSKNVVPSSSSTNNYKAFVPAFSESDKVFSQAKYVVKKYGDIIGKIEKCETFSCINKELDNALSMKL